MAKKRELTGVYIDSKCRICLNDDGCMSDIFSEDIKPKIYTLGDSTSVHINDDKHSPRNICHVCLYKLDMWIEFKEQFLRSNAMLREHLGLAELSDNATTAAKRKHGDSEERAEADSIEHSVVKKMKTAESTKVGSESLENAEKIVESSESKGIEDSLSKNNSEEPRPVEKSIASENQSSSTRVAAPAKQTTSRRVKTTDKREASTKRWVARKKALLAATGNNETDTTDSESSDEAQLSSVHKARKSNAEIVVENQRISKTRKSQESDNEEKRNTRATIIAPDLLEKSEGTVKIVGSLDKKDASSPLSKEPVETKNPIPDESSKIISRVPPENRTKNFIPQSVRSKLIVDEATFIVTSTLVLAEPRHLTPVNSLDKSSKSLPLESLEESNQERNTDIIDAVQLRRVCPKSPPPHGGKKFIERCLNIEVEGTELETLQRVQTELAKFVETKLMKALEPGNNETIKHPYHSLDQQVKEIVERSIKKNVEASRMDRLSPVARGENTFTSEFVTAAMRSRIFQPRVLLVRCEGDRDETSKRINRTSDAQATLGKRRSVKPAKYADYDASSANSPSEDSRDVPSKQELHPTDEKSDKFKTYAPALAKQANASSSNNPRGQENVPEAPKDRVPDRSLLTSHPDKNPRQSIKSTANDQNIRANLVPKKAPVEKHICGVCGDSFGTRKEVEIHFSNHKSPATIARQVKQKMMRCKRCHEIVEARYVKLHVCKSPKNNYKCYVCEATFRSDKILIEHLETHASEEKPKIEALGSMEVDEKPDIPPGNTREPSKATAILARKRAAPQLAGQTSDTYTCFVCDKTFGEEDVLKDHLQKHCDDMSEEEEPSDDREQYQCAICGETMESEDALESHVEKHLFDDEDDNPNLISIGARERTKNNQDMIHGCTECSEKFDSEMLLMLHMQAHEEEVAMAEWERRRVDNSTEEQHICVICDQLFASEAELSEHLDVHNGNAHVCLLCDKPFLTLEELQAHVNTH